MRKLTASQLTEREKVAHALVDAAEAVRAAVEKYNTKMSEAWVEVDKAVEEYNRKVEDANNFIQEIHSDMESYYDEKSEKWQEGEAGQLYREWLEAWTKEIDDCELDQPDELEEPDLADDSDIYDPSEEP
jgi:lipopolysaccharide biosynthesis regulator YciM